MAVSRTIQDIIYRSLRQLHVIRADETPETADMNTGLSVLQDMIAALASEGIMIPMVTTEHFTLVPGQTEYYVGQGSYYLLLYPNGSQHLQIDPNVPGAIILQSGIPPTLNTVRPETVLGAFVVDDAEYTHYVEIIKEAAYAGIIDKTLTNQWPECVYIAYTSPNLTFYMYPVPDTAFEFYFYSDKPFIEPTSFSQDILDDIQIPRSYHKVLADLLTMELAPEYGVEPSAIIVNNAIRGKSGLISASAARRINPAKLEIGMAPHKTYSLVDFFGGY